MNISKAGYRFIALAVSLHVVLFAYVIFDDAGALTKTSVGKFYNSKVVIGPFFMEERLKSAPHLLLRDFSRGEWSAWKDVSMTYKRTYDSSFWRYGSIMKSEYALHLAYKIALTLNGDTLLNMNQFGRHSRALHRLLVTDHWVGNRSDSVQLVYCGYRVDLEDRSRTVDSLWNIKYSMAESVQNSKP